MASSVFNMIHEITQVKSLGWKKVAAIITDLVQQRSFCLISGIKNLISARDNNVDEDVEKSILFEYDYPSSVKLSESFFRSSWSNFQQDFFNKSTELVDSNFSYKCEVIRSASVLTNGHSHISIYDKDGKLKEDYSWFKKLAPPNVQYKNTNRMVPGVTLNLATMGEAIRGNHAHALIDELSKMFLVDKFSTHIPDIDNILVPNSSPSFMDMYLALGFSEDKIITFKAAESVEYEQLLCISPPRGVSSNIVPGWIVDGYRSRISKAIPSDKHRYRKIYVSRGDAGYRKIDQESALIKMLTEQGYTALEMSDYSLEEKAGIFSCAESVIGLTGAGIQSVMFCQPGTQVIELYPSKLVNYLYYSIAGYLELNHHQYVMEPSVNCSSLNPYLSDVSMDLDHFESFLKQLNAQFLSNGVCRAV